MMMIFWLLGIAIAVMVVWYLWRSKWKPSQWSEDPDEILKRRYARGEIDDATYERMRTELHSGDRPDDEHDVRPASS